MTKPVLNLRGGPGERGRVHGETLSREIGENLERFRLLGFEREAPMAESTNWTKWAEALRPKDPVFRDEVDGVAEGTGRSLEAYPRAA